MRSLERKILKEQRETRAVKATTARNAVERAEMEDFFMQCVEVSAVLTTSVPRIIYVGNGSVIPPWLMCDTQLTVRGVYTHLY